MKKSFSYICRALLDGLTLNQFSEGMRKIVNEYAELNRNERYQLYLVCYNLYRACKHRIKSGDWQEYLALRKSYDSVLRVARRVQRNLDLRRKRKEVRELLDAHTSSTVFYVCSKHSKPAPDHADFQGRIYVDKFWRSKVDSYLFRAIEAYIKNHQIVSVQKIMGPPVYMTTRPYCKHYFIPVDTYEVLHSSQNRIVEMHGIHRPKLYTADDYYDLRKKVYQICDILAEHEAFKKKQKRA